MPWPWCSGVGKYAPVTVERKKNLVLVGGKLPRPGVYSENTFPMYQCSEIKSQKVCDGKDYQSVSGFKKKSLMPMLV